MVRSFRTAVVRCHNLQRKGPMMSGKISRRTVLRGVGTALALPWLEAMGPLSAWADQTAPNRAPNRMAFVYVPNGVHMPDWRPTATGDNFQLPKTLEPLQQ